MEHGWRREQASAALGTGGPPCSLLRMSDVVGERESEGSPIAKPTLSPHARTSCASPSTEERTQRRAQSHALQGYGDFLDGEQASARCADLKPQKQHLPVLPRPMRSSSQLRPAGAAFVLGSGKNPLSLAVHILCGVLARLREASVARLQDPRLESLQNLDPGVDFALRSSQTRPLIRGLNTARVLVASAAPHARHLGMRVWHLTLPLELRASMGVMDDHSLPFEPNWRPLTQTGL
ncbi:hypothetical protein DFH06DRAFT_1324017 [Mycena polygramma]|nr:hypothetical protein DFH06DRAFT_1324017 [Mycena polygramma]